MEKKASFAAALFIVFTFISPFFLILIQNYPIIQNMENDTVFDHNQLYIEEINTLRGEAINNKLEIPGRLVVNKYTFYSWELAKRYFHSFDPGFLFFNGGIDRFTSTGETGQLPLSFLPILIYGIYGLVSSNKRVSKFMLAALIILPLLSVTHYDKSALLPRLPLLTLLVGITVKGFRSIVSKSKLIAVILILTILVESVLIYHKFANHYTHNIIQQKFTQ